MRLARTNIVIPDPIMDAQQDESHFVYDESPSAKKQYLDDQEVAKSTNDYWMTCMEK